MAKNDMAAFRTRKEEKAAEGKVATAEYLSEADHRAANMAKLRQERLAREAVEAAKPPAKKAPKKKVFRSW